MTTAEIKNNLHRMVVETDDRVILEQIVALFATLKEEKNWADAISPREKLLVEKGRKDMKEGKMVSRSEIQAQTRQIFSKP
jgi:hypothetical protein